MKIEHSHVRFRAESFNADDIRGTSRFTADEVRDILAPRHGHPALPDLRQLGCPDAIFEQQVEQRARKLGIAPQPKAESVADDLERRLAESQIF